MSIAVGWEAVLTRLEHNRALLLGTVADELTYTLPMLAVPQTAADPVAYHQRQIYATVERLHDSLQAVALSEQLLAHEFAWAAQSLPRLGVSAEHLAQMIDGYVSAARSIGTWGPGERAALEEIRAYLRGLVSTVFQAGEGPQPAQGV